MREERLIEKIEKLVGEYRYDLPFSLYLKRHFRKNPSMGSRDRRDTREWAYNLFRIGKNLSDLPLAVRLGVACYLCNDDPTSPLAYPVEKYAGLDRSEMSQSREFRFRKVTEKFPGFQGEKIFPMHAMLSPEIDRQAWYLSFLRKPKIWIRIRKEKVEAVIAELSQSNISFDREPESTVVSFAPDTPLQKTLSWERGYFEIQDLSSQEVKQHFSPVPGDAWWDACSGSGGKSLLLLEKENDIDLLATDNRTSILENYKERLKKAGHNKVNCMVHDLSGAPLNPGKLFDGIIADVPCSGSGTWSRNPEWLQSDHSSRVHTHFVPLQRKIVGHALTSLKSGKPLIYITCSAFLEENEGNIQYFRENLRVEVEYSAYIKGFSRRADTLFLARLIHK
jgi:16S rRNA (cytosine967-C5)-methyltransferase